MKTKVHFGVCNEEFIYLRDDIREDSCILREPSGFGISGTGIF